MRLVWLACGRTVCLWPIARLIRLSCGRTICLRTITRLIRLSCGRTVCLWTIARLIRLSCGRTVSFRPVARLVWLACRRAVCFRTIARLVRLCSGPVLGLVWPVLLRWICGTRTLVRLIAWAIPGFVRTVAWLIRRRLLSWLTRATGIHGTPGGRRRRFAGRRLLNHRVRSRTRRGAQTLHLALRYWLSRMRCHRLLLFGKRHWRRWRSALRDHLPVRDGLWRRSHMTCRGSFRSEHAFAGGSNRNPGGDRCARKLLGVHGNCRASHWLRAGERALRYYRDRALHVSIRVVHVRDCRTFVDDGGVVDIRDYSGVDRGVADVYLVHVAPADLVGRNINLTWT